MAEINLKKDAASAEMDRVKAEAEQMCPACEHMLWVSFYFDGFGFGEKDGPRTNILKLFNAAYDKKNKNMRRFYYPGLGANFDPESGVLGAVLKDKATDTLGEKFKDKAKEMTVGKAKEEALKRAGDAWTKSGEIRNPTLGNRVGDTFDTLLGQAKGGVSDAKKRIERAIARPSSEKNRALRYLRREWRGFWRDVVRYPYRIPKTIVKEIGKETLGAGVESFRLTRDTRLGAALFNTGVDTRLKAAEEDFKAAVAGAKKAGTLNRIHIAIFGYDMGGGLALAFAKRLLEETCKGGKYDGVPIKIKFMGLFDCVTNRFDDNLLTGYIPLSNAVSSDLILSPDIEKCVHYAAAHELRVYKPLTMLGADPADGRGRRQERLFPGSQVDVGGGAIDGEDGISDKLARVPLEMMYYRAYGAGIPMPSLNALANEDGALYQQIVAPPDVERFHLDYRLAVKKLVTTTREIPNLSGLGLGKGIGNGIGYGNRPGMPGMQKPSGGPLDFLNPKAASDPMDGCRPQDAAPPRPIVVTDLPKDIQGELKGHMVVYIQWLRMWYDQPRNKTAADQRKAGWLGGAADPLAYGRYDKLMREIDYLKQHGTRPMPGFDQKQALKQLGGDVPASMFNLDPQAQALFWLWNNPGARLPQVEAMYPIFVKHMHDSMAESDIEAVYSHLVAIKNYMNTRAMQKIATAPDKTFLDRVADAYHSLFPSGSATSGAAAAVR
ncbi:phospholipase effector Tle1 domain-containing protein [Burkholderia sp. PU8-34]